MRFAVAGDERIELKQIAVRTDSYNVPKHHIKERKPLQTLCL